MRAMWVLCLFSSIVLAAGKQDEATGDGDHSTRECGEGVTQSAFLQATSLLVAQGMAALREKRRTETALYQAALAASRTSLKDIVIATAASGRVFATNVEQLAVDVLDGLRRSPLLPEGDLELSIESHERGGFTAHYSKGLGTLPSDHLLLYQSTCDEVIAFLQRQHDRVSVVTFSVARAGDKGTLNGAELRRITEASLAVNPHAIHLLTLRSEDHDFAQELVRDRHALQLFIDRSQ